MKIVIDISPIIYGIGTSVYTRNLIESLLKIDRENEYILFGGSLRRFGEMKKLVNRYSDTVNGNASVKIFPIPPTFADLIWNRVHLFPVERLVGKVDIFHSSDWTQPPSNAFKVTTIHDLVPIKFPKLSNPKIVSAHNARLSWVKKEVNRVIVPSQSTMKDVVKIGIDQEKIKVISEAPDSIFKPAKKIEVERIKRKYHISGKYLLSIGINPRKNPQRIIKAYEKVKVGENLKLVIIGHPYMKLDVPRGVVVTGHAPDGDLPILYSGAESLVYPSIYEGFGLPILEAYACKVPVVTSNIGSMAEVAGKAAILVDPYDVDSIAGGILKAIKNKEKLVKLGSKHVKQFSWEKTAKETLKVYEEVI